MKRLVIDIDEEKLYKKFKVIRETLGLNNTETLKLLIRVFEEVVERDNELEKVIEILEKVK